MKIALQSDPIETFDINTDTSYSLALYAQQNKGYDIWHYDPSEISYFKDKVSVYARSVSLDPLSISDIKYGPKLRCDLENDFNIILMRQDPPFDMHYIAVTHLLQRVSDKVRIINNPQAVREAPEKISVLDYADLMPETGIAFNFMQLEKLCQKIGDCIVKPLFGNGGEGIIRTSENDANQSSVLEVLMKAYPRQPLMVQKYLPGVVKGDKRIILVDGNPVGALNRIPAKDEVRANLHVGGTPEIAELTKQEKHICQRLGPWLKSSGLYFCGIDVIDDKLTEINITSPTGIREIKKLGGTDIAKIFWNGLTG